MFAKVLGRSAIVAAALMAVAPAQATTFMFPGTGLSGSYGNSLMPAAIDGISFTVTAWSRSSAGTVTTAYLGRYDSGLGVTNRSEGNGSNNRHTIDNADGYDFVQLVFNTAVNLQSINKVNYGINGVTDGDYWISTGNTAVGTDYASNASFSNSAFSTVWLIGAARNMGTDDGFKLKSINVVTRPAVPEPATWLSMILGFGAIGTVVRRRARVMAKVRALLAATLGRKLLTGPSQA